mgnify:CR=1 FL=1
MSIEVKDRKIGSKSPRRVKFFTEGETRTRQEFAKECDINEIMKKYKKGELVQHVKEYGGRYGEFVAIDFKQAMDTVAEAQSMFETIPSNIRSKFDNDPGQFLKFATDAKNADEMREMGLVPPPDVPVPLAEATAAQLDDAFRRYVREKVLNETTEKETEKGRSEPPVDQNTDS